MAKKASKKAAGSRNNTESKQSNKRANRPKPYVSSRWTWNLNQRCLRHHLSLGVRQTLALGRHLPPLRLSFTITKSFPIIGFTNGTKSDVGSYIIGFCRTLVTSLSRRSSFFAGFFCAALLASVAGVHSHNSFTEPQNEEPKQAKTILENPYNSSFTTWSCRSLRFLSRWSLRVTQSCVCALQRSLSWSLRRLRRLHS